MALSKIKLILASLFMFVSACKEKTPEVNPALANIDFQRGELLFCGDGQYGKLKFSLSCSYETRATFDMAIALLHSFQYDEAEKAFVKVIEADPDCPMAYWGVAMSIYHAAWAPPKEKELIRASKILEVAKQLSMEDKQRDYINAIDAFYVDWKTVDHQRRAKRFEKRMEQVHLKYPEDVEAAIFYTLALFSTRDRAGKEYKNERKAGKILESLFEANPDHPGITHYIIHNYDNPVLAPKALNTARRYAKLAPSSAHAQHMPSHIFTRLGLWDESIQSNLMSAESARCYADAIELSDGYYEELHAMDYLVYAYLQKGDNSNAEAKYDQIKNIRTLYPTSPEAAIYALAAIPARLALENKNWERAANLELQEIDLNWEEFPWEKALHHFAKGLGAAQMKDFDKAEQQIEILQKLHQRLTLQNDPTEVIQIKQIGIQFKVVQAWLAFRKNDPKNGIQLMQEAVEMEKVTSKHPVTPGDVLPAAELMGDMLLELNRPKEALSIYEKNLQERPYRFNGIYGAAVAAEKVGDKEKATLYFGQILELVEDSTSERPEIEEAKEYLEQKAI